MLGREGRKTGCPSHSGGTGELGALGRFSQSSQKVRGEIKAGGGGEEGERFVIKGRQMSPIWVLDFLTEYPPLLK